MADKHTTRERLRAERQEDLRARISQSNLLTAIENTEAEVESLMAGPQVADAEGDDGREKAVKEWLAVAPVKIQAANCIQKSRIERLRKILPDLKAVELSQDPENPVFKDERTLDSEFARLVEAVASAEGRIASSPAGKGPVH